MGLHPDFRDLLSAFGDAEVRYLLVGGYAVSFHGRPRFTRDIDLWVDPAPENLVRVEEALRAFGAPSEVLEALRTASPEDVVWMGAPPVRIDVVKGIPGLGFEEAWPGRVDGMLNDTPVAVIGLDDLIRAKRASGRPQDLLDVEALEAVRGEGG